MPESEMYCPISALLTFIADAIDAAAQEVLRKTIAQKTIDALGTKRRIVPFRKTDSNPKGSDDYHRIDLGLRVVDEAFSDISPKSASKPDYTDMLAVIEVKTDIGKQQNAYQQLFEYSRNIYVNQHDRRFVWGLTVCGAVFRVCLINNDRMLASDPMDVTRPDGRMSLAKWLVNMSFCEKDKLGHDPTVYYNMESAKWEIVVFDDHLERGSMVFQIESCTRIADRAFGRHTRCFECTQIALEPGSADDSNRNSNSQSSFISQQAAKVIVKDAWAIGTNAPADKLRDEVALLREISNKLADRDGLAGKYPTLLAGGVVKQTGKGDKLFNDNSSNVFAALGNKILKEIGTFRVHKRLAMTPIAQDIRHVNSVDELIIAAADAMQAYCEIWGTCEILHRDISTNNILISRYKDVDNRIKVRGMLIDFDCALHVDMSSKRDIRPEMTGTYPFMSINNLANTDVERTPLDDWESIIYVLCWLGTIGVNYEDEEEREESGPAFSTLPIFKWSEGLAAQVASAKRTDMHSHENFRSRIVKRFLNRDSYKPLRHLVMALRQTLINNRKMSSMGQGAFEDNDDDDSDMDFAFARESSGSANISNSGRSFWDDGFKKNETLFDPNECFARRAYCADKISKELLQVILDAREKAVARLF
ncbi:hypothetical protein H4217_004676 [Coemansia sp. RSA 1939]|nr:hypothetical protein H4217_004676 [Coemansia sp. RSA 1939]